MTTLDLGLLQGSNFPDAMPVMGRTPFGPPPPARLDVPLPAIGEPSAFARATGEQMGPPAPSGADPQQGKADAMAGAAKGAQFVGAVTQAVGAFYRTQGQRLAQKQRSSDYDTASRMAMLAARQAEDQAQLTLASRQRAIGLRLGDRTANRARVTVALAARGGAVNSGSAAAVMATLDWQSRLEAHNMAASALREAQATRVVKDQQRARARSFAISARAAERAASLTNPYIDAALAGANAALPLVLPQA